jgi:hypothetical protein
MAHPSRAGLVDRLVADLGGDVPVLMDDQGLGNWGNAKRAWAAHGGKRWHLVVQDDVQLCDGFLERAARFRRDHPDGIVSFFLGSRVRHLASLTEADLERGWKRMPAGNAWPCAQALCLPVEHIPAMTRYGNRLAYRYKGIADDVRIFRYFGSIGADAWYPLPSLVEHLDIPSVIGHRPCRAACFAGRTEPPDGR